jgi:hypothetical protein
VYVYGRIWRTRRYDDDTNDKDYILKL